MESKALRIIDMSMKYPGKSENTLKQINLEIRQGEVVGFIGRNGSGKSTTIKCLTGVLHFDTGQVIIGGYDLVKDPLLAKKLIGYNPDNHAVYEEMTGREYVLFISQIFKTVDNYKKHFDEYVEQFEMTQSIDKRIGTYSHGMKQKICLIATLIHDPMIWILDEPFTGLDVVATYYLKQHLKRHKENNRAIFLTSHDISTIAQICDKVAIIDQGRIVEEILMKDFDKQQSLEDYFYQKLRITSSQDQKRELDV